MDLLLPGSGLLFWQIVSFLALFFLLKTFAWKPILAGIKDRERFIEDAINSAETAKEEMAQLKADNEKLLEEARIERDKIIREALEAAKQIKDEAKEEAAKSGKKILDDAKAAIEIEKKAAMTEVKTELATLSLNIAEQVLRKNLSDDKAQKALAEEFVKDLKLN